MIRANPTITLSFLIFQPQSIHPTALLYIHNQVSINIDLQAGIQSARLLEQWALHVHHRDYHSIASSGDPRANRARRRWRATRGLRSEMRTRRLLFLQATPTPYPPLVSKLG